MSQYDDRSWYPSMATGQCTSYQPNALFEMAKLGTLIGLTGAGAANLHRFQQGEVGSGEAALSTLRTGVASGVATAAATLVASQFRSPALALAATLATGTATMYALNAAGQSKREPSAELTAAEGAKTKRA